MSEKQDLRAHLKLLEQSGKLHRISRSVNKDTELMPLVRWQFRGLEESQRCGFLFESVTDARGREFNTSVAVGIYAASSDVYALGMGCAVDEIQGRWLEAQARPIKPRIVESGPVQEEIHVGETLLEHGGVDEFPIPISTPGFDNAPYVTAANWVTRDPESGWLNVGNYRGQIKPPDRIGIDIHPSHHGADHWRQALAKGQNLEAALVIGGPPSLTFASGTPIPSGVEEYDIAGSLIGEPLDLVHCQTVDLLVPAYAELVLEGRISTEYLEPEAPFGEFPGYMGPRRYALVFELTAVTHRKDAVFCGLLSQMPPSESSKMKKIGQDANYLHFLRNHCNLREVVDVWFDEIALHSWCVVRMKPCNASLVWQALYAVLGRHTEPGKMVIAVDEDIDPGDFESVVWALSYRMQPDKDMVILPENRAVALDPSGVPPSDTIAENIEQVHFGSTVLINAMRKWAYPPVSLPAQPFMENARKIWEEIGLPTLNPRVPWFGYELGDWTDRDREEAKWAVEGEYHRTADRAKQQRRAPSLGAKSDSDD